MSKATFGATKIDTDTKNIKESKNTREELGAIWEHTSKTDNKYMNIVLNIPKSELLDLIASSSTKESDKIKIDFVAFQNKTQDGNSKRPTYRIFKSLKK